MLGGVGDRLTGDGWPVGWSETVPGCTKGTLGGIGANFFETVRENNTGQMIIREAHWNDWRCVSSRFPAAIASSHDATSSQ